MGDKCQEDLKAEDVNSSKSEKSTAESSEDPWRLSNNCIKFGCNSHTDPCNISQTNSAIVEWIVRGYWKELTTGTNVTRCHREEIGVAEKRAALFIGDKAEKHAALHKVYCRLAECYYMELRHEYEDRCRRHCSETNNLDDLKGIDDIYVAERFKKVDFKTPETTVIWLEELEYLQESIQQILHEKIASLTSVDESWLVKASKEQHNYNSLFTVLSSEDNGCYWIKIKKGDADLLKIVGYAIYKKTHSLKNYSDDQLEKIKLISSIICSQSLCDIVSFSCIFILYKLEKQEIVEPVFRVKCGQDVRFVDINQRVYVNWDDFEANNKLPKCLYCCPYKGEYNKKKDFRVTFSWSPASYAVKKAIGILDVVGIVVTVGSVAALGAAAAFPTRPSVKGTLAAVAGTLAAVALGAYCGGSRGVKIWDKVSDVQRVGTHNVVNVFSNVLSVASGGVAEAVPALATMDSSLLFTQSAVQGVNALTTTVSEFEENNNIALQSGELTMKTLMFLNSKSPKEAIEKIKETYDLSPNESIISVIKKFVAANSIPSVNAGRVQKYFSKSLHSLMLRLLDALGEEAQSIFTDMLFLRDIFNCGKFTSMDRAFDESSVKERKEFFRLLMHCVSLISSLCATSVPLRAYFGIEFYDVSDVFEQIDFSVLAKGSFAIDKYLDRETRNNLQTYLIEILTLICDGDEIRADSPVSLKHYGAMVRTKWPEILSAFKSSNIRKKVRFEN